MGREIRFSPVLFGNRSYPKAQSCRVTTYERIILIMLEPNSNIDLQLSAKDSRIAGLSSLYVHLYYMFMAVIYKFYYIAVSFI